MPLKAYIICLARKAKKVDSQIFNPCPGIPNFHFIPIVLKDEFKMTGDEKKFKQWEQWEERFKKLAKFDGLKVAKRDLTKGMPAKIKPTIFGSAAGR